MTDERADHPSSEEPSASPPERGGAAAILRAIAPWVLVILGGLFLFRSQSAPPMPEGEALPSLSLTLASGEPFDLEAERGRPLLLTFWASWCPACRAEAPAIQAAHERLEGVGGTAIGLAVDRRSIPAAERLGMRFPQGVVAQEDLARFGVELLPTTILVDREGRVAASFVGEVTPDTLNDALEPLLDPTLATR
jgi:thiol-disulfide isomerase/thioredoxin